MLDAFGWHWGVHYNVFKIQMKVVSKCPCPDIWSDWLDHAIVIWYVVLPFVYEPTFLLLELCEPAECPKVYKVSFVSYFAWVTFNLVLVSFGDQPFAWDVCFPLGWPLLTSHTLLLNQEHKERAIQICLVSIIQNHGLDRDLADWKKSLAILSGRKIVPFPATCNLC